jgi:hypothetical protein
MTYDESKHPRDPKGTKTGGQWAVAGKAARKAAGLQPDWKPSMTRAEVELWAEDSVYKEDLYHGTDTEAAAAIKSGGFDLSIYKNGRVFGNGVYLSTEEKMARQYGVLTGGETLTAKINVQDVLVIDSDDTFNDIWFNAQTFAFENEGMSQTEKLTEYMWDEMGVDAVKVIGRPQDYLVVFDPKNIVVIKGKREK